MTRHLLPLALLALLAGCIPRSDTPQRQPRSEPPPRAATPPTTAPAAADRDWRDIPLAPGDWVFRQEADGAVALYGEANRPALFTLRCDKEARRVWLARAGRASGPVTMTVITSYRTRDFRAEQRDMSAAALGAQAPANDPFLDAIAFSRGRFVVEVPGLEPLALPAWPEPARAIQECRS